MIRRAPGRAEPTTGGQRPCAFAPLYLATLLLQLAAGLLSSWVALRMAAAGSADWLTGSMMAANALGMMLGGLSGYRLLARVGHVRAFALACGLATLATLGHFLEHALWLWSLLRLLVGLALLWMFMVLESWLNEQAPPARRGGVLAGYMMASSLGLIAGQLGLSLDGAARAGLLYVVAGSFALCLLPLLLARRPPLLAQGPLGLQPLRLLRRVPQAWQCMLLSGLVSGSFFGLAPVYASQQGLSVRAVGLFMALYMTAGLLGQWPLGRLSDRFPRPQLILGCAVLLALACLPLLATPVSLAVLLGCGSVIGLLQFALYPLALGLANEGLASHERVSLAAGMLLTFGLGSTLGPLCAGLAMSLLGSAGLYLFTALCAVLLTGLLLRGNSRRRSASSINVYE